MPVYVALLQKNDDGSYRVSFPDLPGIIAAGDTLDEAIEEAEETLEYAAGDWRNADGSTGLPPPRSIDQLRDDPKFADSADGGTVVEIDYEPAE